MTQSEDKHWKQGHHYLLVVYEMIFFVELAKQKNNNHNILSAKELAND